MDSPSFLKDQLICYSNHKEENCVDRSADLCAGNTHVNEQLNYGSSGISNTYRLMSSCTKTLNCCSV